MVLTLDVWSPEALRVLRRELTEGAPGRGEVLVRLKTGEGEEPLLRLGRDFELDGELAERLAEIDGLSAISLTARRGPSRLRLVA